MADPAPFFWFDDEAWHAGLPPAARALRDPNGLLAAGGDLSVATLLGAYRQGVFPWYSAGQPILWWSPDPRTVLWPAHFHLSRSLARTLRRGRFELSIDRQFSEVVEACGPARPGGGETWITPAMRLAYTRLHEAGHAHSVECWQDGKLVGGVYGVALGRCFFGESMFSRVTDASKVALAWLCRKLVEWEINVFDCQMESAHLTSLGAVSLPRQDFLALLENNASQSPAPAAWLPGPDHAP